ncbi:N-acetylglutamate synthase [Paucilactobacillus hokkaidonensis JCM 18461]|uniref:Arginine biosynthesis bifunctional protein ArgJ n=2 Tax=Paucilactobacillus hokkaidonensis TaxID=1193095 RepID=A0A0A1GW68_9LACO|nr:bifunctional glutamate N-acetyltransferase/amino-acid acetyltransferase ArgJ [Paucilactobacillus hokkaidonensis]KRO08824.1 bifunctional ornithine acetyltransferase N-acetylglutamate synthase protein [Paucilactobacillus hokkaidonensis]BAP84611.1 N-acetylglutamate synthase [Paucilactobacillus hokkaidonensis JCM 18461]
MQVLEQKINEIKFTWPLGFYSDAVHSGLKADKKDLGWLYSEVPAKAAGVYTTNQFQAAPIKLTKQTINHAHMLQAMIINSANANSCTGQQGELDAQTMQQLAAQQLHLEPAMVGVASTGIIGQLLPMTKVTAGISMLKLANSADIISAIQTTDQHEKKISVQVSLNDGQSIIITGFAKGSGMIHPNMATMLGFVTTDADIDGIDLQQLLSGQVDDTFNQITVDGDTSTNDMVIALANGKSNVQVVPETAEFTIFAQAFKQVLSTLAKGIASDGEGATKLVEVNVTSAESHLAAQQVAKAIVGSNLVKAAIFGADANWGRIMGAIGQTDAKIDPTNVMIMINGVAIVKQSQGIEYDHFAMQQALEQSFITIDVDVHAGTSSGQAWGCDLTYNYVKINAAYHS